MLHQELRLQALLKAFLLLGFGAGHKRQHAIHKCDECCHQNDTRDFLPADGFSVGVCHSKTQNGATQRTLTNAFVGQPFDDITVFTRDLVLNGVLDAINGHTDAFQNHDQRILKATTKEP
jgi:hypothetical protein